MGRRPRQPGGADGGRALPLTTEAGCLVAEGVHLTYGVGPARVRALNDVSLKLAAGDYLALKGPSGSGKTSLLHCLGGLARPGGGEVRWNGVRLADLALEARVRTRGAAFAYLFQGANLLPSFTAAENLAFAAFIAGRDDGRTPTELLDRLGLHGKQLALPEELSGGEQQRVALARALAQGAKVLLADEPTGQLDKSTAAVVLDLIDEVRHRNPAVIVVVATHDGAVAARARRVLQIVDGRISGEQGA